MNMLVFSVGGGPARVGDGMRVCVCARVDVGRYVLPYTIPQHGPWWWEEGVQGAPAGGGERLTLGRVPRGPPGRAWPWINRCEQCELRGLGELGRWGPAEMG